MSEGQLGLVRSAVFRRRCAAPAWGGWLKRPELSGGGVFDLLIHDVDIMPAPVRQAGARRRPPATTTTPRGIDIIHARVPLLARRRRAGHRRLASSQGVPVLDGVHGGRRWRHARIQFRRARSDALPRGRNRGDSSNCRDQDGYCGRGRVLRRTAAATGRQPEICPPRESADAVKLTRLMLEARNKNGERIECNL